MANNQPSEQEIQFRKRARRRLIGAIALVLLMVTVLPMVLDDQQATAPQPEIAISIPSQDGDDFASRIVPVAPATAPAPQVEAAPAAPAEQGGKPVEAAPASTPAADAEAAAAAEAPEVAAPAKPAATPAASGAGFVVQIGVYSDAANVRKLQDKLAAKSLKTYVENLNTAGGVKIRLRMGPYASRADAEQGLQALQAAGVAGLVVAR